MFDPQTAAQLIFENARQHPLKFLEHIVAGSSSLVAGLCVAQKLLQLFQGWVKKWFPNSSLIASAGRVEYGVEAATDFVEIFALNWRHWIVPKQRDVWDDAKRQEQLGEKSSAAGAGKP
jgi:hypothetical protein